MKSLARFGRFWWDFIVGDDWLVAAMVFAAIALTALLTHRDVNAWWLIPLATVAALALSIRRAKRAAEGRA